MLVFKCAHPYDGQDAGLSSGMFSMSDAGLRAGYSALDQFDSIKSLRD